MDTMSASVELMIFAPQTALFERYGNYYRTRFAEDMHKPLTEPITEFREALVLLFNDLNDRTERCLKPDIHLPNGTRGSAIQIQVFNGGYGRCELSATHLFPVSQEIVEELRREHLLSGTPHMGYTDMEELHLNESAAERIVLEVNNYKKELETSSS
jgi:hypothetical protein